MLTFSSAADKVSTLFSVEISCPPEEESNIFAWLIKRNDGNATGGGDGEEIKLLLPN